MALAWGNARTQFQLVRAQVEAELEKGMSKRQIFEALRNEGKISMTEITFYKYAAKALNPNADSMRGKAIAPSHDKGGSGSSNPQTPLLPDRSRDKNRFQMDDDIPSYD